MHREVRNLIVDTEFSLDREVSDGYYMKQDGAANEALEKKAGLFSGSCLHCVPDQRRRSRKGTLQTLASNPGGSSLSVQDAFKGKDPGKVDQDS